MNPYGFLTQERELPAKAPVAERLQHFKEFVGKWTPQQVNHQSSRCMSCGVPFCHSGCPLGNVIPEFNDAVHRGKWEQAYEILTATNNFPEFTGRICPAPCESACVLGINQKPVAIEEIERHIIEYAFENGYVRPASIQQRTGKKIAVIGSGPAGLAAATQLNLAGHQVTVFERDDAPGGLLRYGIPDFKLEKHIVDRRIKIMEAEGVQFRCGVNVGVDVAIDDLLRSYQAIVLAGGSTIPRDLNIPGRHLKGVHFAMDFLKNQNKANAAKIGQVPEAYQVRGKNVVVIGGGDTGSDCVGTSNRQGAASVRQLELMPMPPAARTANMPWPLYPMVLRTSTSQEEGCERQFSIVTKAFLGDERGQLRAIQTADLEWQLGKDGRPGQFAEIPGSEREIPCEAVFLAMGFLHPQHEGMLQSLEVELDERGNVRAAEKNYQTNIAKIFAAGDMRRGQSLVVWAISEGRECARKVDEYLMGSSTLPKKDG